MLARSQDSDHSILDGVQFVSKALHERIIEGKQIGVLTLVESLLFEITNELVTDLMP